MKTNDLLIIVFGGLAITLYLGRKPLVKAVGNQVNRFKYGDFFKAAEIANGLPTGLLEKMAEVESGFRDDVISGKVKSSAGAVGIMQIVPKWHPAVNPYDAVASIQYAGRYVKDLYNQLGSWPKALAAYNWGIGNVQKYGMTKLPTETQNYIKKILG